MACRCAYDHCKSLRAVQRGGDLRVLPSYGESPFKWDFPETPSLPARFINCTIYEAADSQPGGNYMGGMSQSLYSK